MYDPNWGTSPICQIGDRKKYKEKIKLYINKTYPIIVIEDFMLNDWTYVQKTKKNKMNNSYKEVSIHLDENKKE
jgi:transposase-like protein